MIWGTKYMAQEPVAPKFQVGQTDFQVTAVLVVLIVCVLVWLALFFVLPATRFIHNLVAYFPLYVAYRVLETLFFDTVGFTNLVSAVKDVIGLIVYIVDYVPLAKSLMNYAWVYVQRSVLESPESEA